MATLTPSLNYITITTTDYAIRGYVYNRIISEPYPNAYVYCYSETTRELITSTIADTNGEYVIYVPAGDTYFLVSDAPNAQAGVIDSVTPKIP